ncbi:MAG: CDP-glycerol glycerophosphotransferase family protein, partial [Candidatus Gastranaerophilaceae bacterium]
MRRNMSFLENIFSVKNSDLNHKQICFMGVKIKLHKDVKAHYAYENLPIEHNKIIFRTFNGGYNCNPKYIAEEIIKQNLPYKLVWVVNKNILNFIDDFPRDRIKLVMNGTIEEVRETATAKIIIDNERRTNYIQRGIFKKPEQIYIQTFHG